MTFGALPDRRMSLKLIESAATDRRNGHTAPIHLPAYATLRCLRQMEPLLPETPPWVVSTRRGRPHPI